MGFIDPVRDKVVAEFPLEFFQYLATRQEAAYGQARDYSQSSPLWMGPEAKTVLPIARRAAFENELRLAAAASGVRHFDQEHVGHYPYGVVRTSKIAVSAHHVASPDSFVRPCVSRKQNAGLNKILDQMIMREVLQESLPDLEDAGVMYACILHGLTIEKRAGQTFQKLFLNLAFPDSEFKRYHRNYEISELICQYQVAVPILEEFAQEDKAIPVLNPKIRKQIVGE